MANKGKTILILGNGFDLAHGLPTKYSHFLDFCQRVEKIWSYDIVHNKTKTDFKREWIDGWETNVSIKEAIETAFCNQKIISKDEGKATYESLKLTEIHECLDDNVWYAYFTELYNGTEMKGENWIDFESEIRFIIKYIDEKFPFLTDRWDDIKKVEDIHYKKSKINKFVKNLSFKNYTNRKYISESQLTLKKKIILESQLTIKDFREKTFGDLERLTRALELYLSVFVEKIPIKDEIPEISSLAPDYVINFNYTNTYERIYKKNVDIHHIHGKADAERPAEENNMVLGIDEYWTKDNRDERTNFTVFKKFSQRIQKHTGNESYKYLKIIQKSFNANASQKHSDGVSYVYIFGHSLDSTDKDILSDFIGDDATSVIIYCMDKGTEGELIANTIKLISEKTLLAKANHVPTKLDYIIPKGK